MNDHETRQRCLLCGETFESGDHTIDHLYDDHEVLDQVVDALTVPVGERLKIGEQP